MAVKSVALEALSFHWSPS